MVVFRGLKSPVWYHTQDQTVVAVQTRNADEQVIQWKDQDKLLCGPPGQMIVMLSSCLITKH